MAYGCIFAGALRTMHRPHKFLTMEEITSRGIAHDSYCTWYSRIKFLLGCGLSPGARASSLSHTILGKRTQENTWYVVPA